MVRAADLVTLPGMKKAPKKRIAAILEPSDDVLGEENGDTLPESEEKSSDTEDLGKNLILILVLINFLYFIAVLHCTHQLYLSVICLAQLMWHLFLLSFNMIES